MPKVSPSRQARPRLARRTILTVLSPEFSVSSLIQMSGAVASQPWHAANDPIAFPFRLSEAATVDQLGTANGTAAGGGFDIGVYSSAWVRLVSTGTQTGSGNSLWQFINVTDTALAANTLYYLVMARDNVTANRQRAVNTGGSARGLQLAGTMDSTTDAYPLPDPLTNMVSAAVVTSAPLVAVGMRGPF